MKYVGCPVKYTSKQKGHEERFYKKGKIMKKGDGPINYNWSERFAILENTNFIYYAEDQDQSAPSRIVFLQGAKVELYEDFDVEYGFVLIPSDDSKPLYLSGLSEGENEEWYHTLKAACERCQIDFDNMGEFDDDLGSGANYGGVASNAVIKDANSLKDMMVRDNMVLFSSDNGIRLFGAVDESYEEFRRKRAEREATKKLYDIGGYFDGVGKAQSLSQFL